VSETVPTADISNYVVNDAALASVSSDPPICAEPQTKSDQPAAQPPQGGLDVVQRSQLFMAGQVTLEMAQRGLSAEELATRLGLPADQVESVMLGKQDSVRVMFGIAAALDKDFRFGLVLPVQQQMSR
jgi:hypothetical protein